MRERRQWCEQAKGNKKGGGETKQGEQYIYKVSTDMTLERPKYCIMNE